MNHKSKKIEKELGKQIQGEVYGDEVHRALYSTAACIYRLKPLAVAYPWDTRDVAQIVSYASQEGIPLTARGAGTGLAGQSLGTGLILDFSRHMRKILEVDPEGSWVKAQPGLVLGDLNRTLNRQGFFFPPDPSSGEYCTLGGMIANNSSGAHSIKYGATKDYILSLELVLADGKVLRTGSVAEGFGQNNENDLIKQMGRILSVNQALIQEKAPRATKNSSGYNLREAFREGRVDLNPLVAGSEGTLALITEAVLRTVRLPQFQGTVLLFFTDLDRAAESIPEICRLGPSVLELMDRTFIELVRGGNLALQKELPDLAKVLFLVEFEGLTSSEVRNKVFVLQEKMINKLGLAFASRQAFDPQEQAQLWAIRKAASPLLDRLEGPGRPTRFIEDVAVEPTQLPQYIRGLQRILEQHGVPGVIFGHAGEGNIHVNPLLDLRTEKGLRHLEEIAGEVYELVRELGGTLSGEHGDGRLRTPFLPGMYGELYKIFRRVKEVFDPNYLLNPGVIVSLSSEEGITHHLRLGQEPETRENGLSLSHPGLKEEIERCQSCGLCKSHCPAFQGMAYEGASPRGKVTLLRETLYTEPEYSSSLFLSREMKQALDLCLHCKRCLSECPLAVDISHLTSAAKSLYRKRKLKISTEIWLEDPSRLGKMCQWLGPLANRLASSKTGKRLLESVLGIHRDRLPLPAIEDNGMPEYLRGPKPKLRSEPQQSPGSELRAPRTKVAYFEGCFARYYSQATSRSLVELLERNGCQVIVPPQKCCGLPKLTHGNIASAHRDAQYNLESLAEVIDRGCQIVTICPSCSLSLKKEYPHWWDNPMTRRVAQNTFDAQEYLLALHRMGKLKGTFREMKTVVAYHDPCHLRAQGLQGVGAELLGLIPGLTIKPLADQCCGMAGTFGLRRTTYPLSLKIGTQLFQEILEMNPAQVATSCGSCQWQIWRGTSIEGIHPLVLLQQAYDKG